MAAAVALGGGATPPKLAPATVAFWQRVHACEEPGQWYQRGRTYVSGLGIYAPNWYRWAARVGVVTAPWGTRPYDQIRVADYGWRSEHAWWGCFAQVGTPP